MATVISVDEFVSDEWYPGFKADYGHAPWYVDPVRTFRQEDEKELWFLDFHWPRGLTPMGLVFNEDGYNWSTQLAAEQLPLPPGRGLTCRLGGTHTYGSAIAVCTDRAGDRPAGPAAGACPARRSCGISSRPGNGCGRKSTRAGTSSAAWIFPRCPWRTCGRT